MQAVITEKQARQITGGRKPLVPVEYEQAVTALDKCVTIDDSKYWSDKADALAAWAKIYRNDDAGRKARQLKLHAYRRMGILAREMRPKGGPGNPYTKGSGAEQLLKSHGLSKGNAQSALAIARMEPQKFDRLVNQPKPPAPIMAAPKYRPDKYSSAYITLMGVGAMANLVRFHSFCQNNDAAENARGLTKDETEIVRGRIADITEWIDELEQHLPKSKP